MPRMRTCAATLVALGLVVFSAPVALAQGSPTGVGTDVPYVDPTGAEGGLVTVRKVEDPFTAFREDSPPGADQRFVQVSVAFEAADDKPFEAHAGDILLQDTDGFLWSAADVTRPSDATPKIIQSQDLSAGDRVSGAIDYVVPKAATIARILYQPPSGGRLIALAEQVPQAGPPVGTDVPYVDPTGAEGGLVTVRKVEDPFTAFREDSPPGADQRFVQVSVAFEAADDKPFEAHAGDILLQDTDGFLWSAADVTRPSDATPKIIQSQDLSAGDRVSGAIDYVVPQAATIARILYQPPSGGRLITVADLTPAAPAPSSGAGPSASPN